MGLRCLSCGVFTDPSSTAEITITFDDGDQRAGTLTLILDACQDRLEQSSVTIVFVDDSGLLPNRSFTFNSSELTSVVCNPINGGLCSVNIAGTGFITGQISPTGFSLNLLDNPSPLADQFISVNFFQFASSNTQADLLPELIVVGCL